MPKLYIRIWDGSTVLAEMQGNSTKQITQEMLNNENVRVEAFLYGNTGSTITPGTYHPMLYQDGDGTWEPYTGGRPSPSPEYPQEIVSTDVTAVTVTGEPYQSKTETITLTEPLRGIGDVRDRIMCKDGVWGVERKIVPLILNGSETWYQFNTSGSKSFGTSDFDSLIKIGSALLCDRLSEDVADNVWNGRRDNTIANSYNSSSKYLRIFLNSTATLDTLKALLSEDPMHVIAGRKSPTWEPLPADAQSALNALTTYKGRTTITVTAEGPEPDVTVEYVQDTRMVVADLQAQINEIRNGGTT